MKKVLIVFIAVLGFASCSSDDNSSDDNSSDDSSSGNESNSFEYELQRVLASKVYAESSTIPAFLQVLKQNSYTVDTLEIALNAIPQPSFSLRIEIGAFLGIGNPAPNDVIVHVNYINFIDFQPILGDNATQNVWLEAVYSYPNNNWFTYSESNINLSNYSSLFRISNGSAIQLGVLPRVDYELETLNSSNDYSVGQEIVYRGIEYIIISKS